MIESILITHYLREPIFDYPYIELIILTLTTTFFNAGVIATSLVLEIYCTKSNSEHDSQSGSQVGKDHGTLIYFSDMKFLELAIFTRFSLSPTQNVKSINKIVQEIYFLC